jgi:hypothetical protein
MWRSDQAAYAGGVTGVKKENKKKNSEKKKQGRDESMRGNHVRGKINKWDLYSLAGRLVEDQDVALAKERAGKTE